MSFKDTFTAVVPRRIIEDSSFFKWLEGLDGSQLSRIEAVRSKINTFGVATNVKALGGGLYEIKWKSGLRLYFAVILSEGEKTLLILGSGKGRNQQQAIFRSRVILQKYDVLKESIKKKD